MGTIPRMVATRLGGSNVLSENLDPLQRGRRKGSAAIETRFAVARRGLATGGTIFEHWPGAMKAVGDPARNAQDKDEGGPGRRVWQAVATLATIGQYRQDRANRHDNQHGGPGFVQQHPQAVQ